MSSTPYLEIAANRKQNEMTVQGGSSLVASLALGRYNAFSVSKFVGEAKHTDTAL